jgi:PBP1b-binding outer membrane lipoprotein LpoB
MKRFLLCLSASLLGTWLLVGCQTPQPSPPGPVAAPPDPAQALCESLLAKGALNTVQNPPARVRILTIVNNTSQHFDTDLFTKRIRICLTDSGKAQIILDPFAEVDFTLSGKIISSYSNTGGARQRTFTYQLTLTNPQGAVVWEDEQVVTTWQQAPPFGI